jgi:predicted nucleic acid-binding Zn ribbon protein
MYENRKNKTPQKLTSILNRTLDKMGLSAGISRSSVVQLWPRIVEPSVAKHARAEKVTGSILHVSVDSSVWMNELSSVRHILLEKINRTLHESAKPITEIRFHQRSWAAEKDSIESADMGKPAKDISEAQKGLIRSATQPLKDPELKEIFQRIMEKDALKSRE